MIRLADVYKSYNGGQTYAVDGVTLEARAGELLVLVGASGCGKTTTLKMINRLIEPTTGSIFINGQDTAQVSAVVLRRTIGYVFQAIGLFPHMTVAQNVAVVPRLLNWAADRTAARIDALLTLVHLPPEEFRERYPRQLSGGQRQRVGFARALAAGPKLMLMDEPFGALDPLTRDHLQVEFRRLHEELGLTTVMVTHDMTEALLLADRIAVMDAGRLVNIGTPHELLADGNGDYVASLLEMPRRQAQRLATISREPEANRARVEP